MAARRCQLAWPTGTGKPAKLKLSVRTLAIEYEIRQIKTPDLRTLVQEVLVAGQQSIEAKYELVLKWMKLKDKYPNYWKQPPLNCGTEAEFLARLRLPEGKTLASLEVMIRLFDRETFLLVGDRALGWMTYLLTRYQDNPATRLKDYQQIFEQYCAKYQAFDERSFEEVVNLYVHKRYIKSRMDSQKQDTMQATKTTDFSKKTAYLATGGSGLRTEKIVRPQVAVNEEGGQSKVVIDYDIKTSLRCSGCRQREEVIRKQMAIIEECKILIRNQQEEIRKLGGEPLPLPEFLKQAFS